MAKIIKMNPSPSPPQPEPKHHIPIIAILFALSAIGSFLYYCFSSGPTGLILSALFFLLCILSLFVRVPASSRTSQSKPYGDKGEQRAGDIFERDLPDDYTVLQNCEVSFGGKISEIDNIVVGKSGVFIIEVKNMKGDVFGDYTWTQWIQNKTDRYGITHEKSFYSPVKQTGTHIYRLANFLRENKIFTHISGAVYFVNSESTLHIIGEPGEMPVFTCRSTPDLLTYIQSGTANLSAKTVAAIVSLLQE